ncbi:hypothetical protein JHW45_10540 [Paracoccus stylophorae]|uniref:Uncharacterized protein n=1 Tax=Paracoccus stylophorae TaxID=659350 RepID=A0ABY7SRA4_9RHOB|nr:hypothetical protein [Paracoccus stylophorae]WCR09554.1 hypothetical protein JHW45_10540 [Paracoccus stylophorae]
MKYDPHRLALGRTVVSVDVTRLMTSSAGHVQTGGRIVAGCRCGGAEGGTFSKPDFECRKTGSRIAEMALKA